MNRVDDAIMLFFFRERNKFFFVLLILHKFRLIVIVNPRRVVKDARFDKIDGKIVKIFIERRD